MENHRHMKTMLEGNRQQMTTTVLFENKKRCFGLKISKSSLVNEEMRFCKKHQYFGSHDSNFWLQNVRGIKQDVIQCTGNEGLYINAGNSTPYTALVMGNQRSPEG